MPVDDVVCGELSVWSGWWSMSPTSYLRTVKLGSDNRSILMCFVLLICHNTVLLRLYHVARATLYNVARLHHVAQAT